MNCRRVFYRVSANDRLYQLAYRADCCCIIGIGILFDADYIGIGLCLGGIIVWRLQYGKLFLTETCMWSNMNGVASAVLRNWILIFTPFMLRKFYRMTGKNWLGPLTLSIFCTLISVNTTTIQQCML